MIKTDDLTWDRYIYPRKHKSNKTVEAYAEALSIGAEFPPIEVQQVNNYPNGNGRLKDATLIVDGVHRWQAYKAIKREQINVVHWTDEVLGYEEWKIALALEAAERNTRHGDRVTEADKRQHARQIAHDDPQAKWTEQQVADKLGVKRQRVNEWISDIRARQRAGRDAQIVRLGQLGWTQEQIARAVGMERSSISKKIVNFAGSGKIHNFIEEGRDMAWVADSQNMDLALAWALRLDGLPDQDRFGGSANSKKPAINLMWGLRTWDDWRFNKCDERFGDDWPGRIPAQLVAHTLFYFTKQGDLVLDPMAGGGVVPDVCLAFGRKCQAFDIAVRETRPEIKYWYWKLGNMQWPDIKRPDLIFFDPPYFTKKQEEYEVKADNGVIPISSLDRSEYLRFFAEFFALARDNVKPTTRLAFLNADWRDFESTPALRENASNAITMFDYHYLLTEAGWQVTHIIDCPLSSERFSGGMVENMQQARILGTTRRSLLVAKKGQ